MPSNPNEFSTGGVIFIHREPRGTQRLVDIPKIYWPDEATSLNFDVTARRTLETGPDTDDQKAYVLGMYHAALLNTLLTLGDAAQDRQEWQPIQRIHDYMDDPDNELLRLNATALMRAINALDRVAIDALPGSKFIEKPPRTTRTSQYRINPRIGFNDLRRSQNHNMPPT